MQTRNIVITKTPLRISFMGGGTDFKYFYKNNVAGIVSSTINRFVYVTVKKHPRFFFENYRLNYSQSETALKVSDIKNDIIRECIKFSKIKEKLYISTISDFPSNTGLGGSSAFVVGLLQALFELQNKTVSQNRLLEYAIKVEIDILKSPIGIQDHISAIYGGLNYIKIHKNSVKIKKIKLNKHKVNVFFKKINLFWTGGTREANRILSDQKKNLKKNISSLKILQKKSVIFHNELKKKNHNFDKICEMIDESWKLKSKFSKKITNKKILNIISLLRKNNFKGIKILGAGGGGFILAFNKNSNINKFHKDLKNISMEYQKTGSQVIYKD